MRPPLAALSRLSSSPAGGATLPPGPAAPGPSSPASKYLTPNNIQAQYDPYATPALSTVGDGPPSPSRMMDDYPSAGGPTLLSVPSPGEGLTRRPSVAIGGVRSPSSANKILVDQAQQPQLQQQVPDTNLPFNINNNNMSSRPGYNSGNNSPAVLLQQPNSYAVNNNNAGPIPPPRKNSISGVGGGGGYGGYGPSSSTGFDSSDEMLMTTRDGHQVERGRSSLRRGPTLSGGVGGGYPSPSEVATPSYNFQQAMNDHFDHYKRPPSRDRSRDPSVDRFSLGSGIRTSSRQSSIAHLTRQESSSSRGVSPAPPVSTPAGGIRSASRQRSGIPPSSSSGARLENSPVVGARHPFQHDPSGGSNSSSGSTSSTLQRRMATPVRVGSRLTNEKPILSQQRMFPFFSPS